MIWEENLKFGQLQEDEIKDYLGEIFPNLIHHKKNKFAIFDFENEDYLIEYKTRNLDHDRYDKFFMSEQKRKHALKADKKVLWIFKYNDGLFYINFDEHKEQFKNMPLKRVETKFGTRHNLEIDINLLKDFSLFNYNDTSF